MNTRERVHVTTLLTDAATNKGQRHGGAKGVQRRRKIADRGRRMQRAVRQRAAGRAEIAASVAVPAAGERRPQALRAWLPFRLPAHRASSARLAGAYPFLTGVAPGAAGVPIGVGAYSGAAASFDPWQAYADGRLTNPNVEARRQSIGEAAHNYRFPQPTPGDRHTSCASGCRHRSPRALPPTSRY